MAASANDLRKGMAVDFKGDVCIVLSTEHRTPPKTKAFIQAELRSLATGKSTIHRFTSGESVELVDVRNETYEFSYEDQGTYHFMEPNTYENLELQADVVEEVKDYLTENMAVQVVFVKGRAASLELPPTVDLKVKESPEGVKGDSATNVMKPATMETGLTVQVPLFIKEGEILRIDTRTGKYLSRAKD